MEPEGSLPHSQVPVTCTCPQPDESNPCPTSHFLKTHLNIYCHLRLGIPSLLFSFRFLHQILHILLIFPIRVTCSRHVTVHDLITRTILGEEYRSINSSLCSFHHFNVTSSLLGPNSLLNSLFSNTINHVPPSM